MRAPACMGGWCANKRDTCARFHAADTHEPAERLCAPGEANAWIPIGAAQRFAEPSAISATTHDEEERADHMTPTVKFKALCEFRKLKPGDAPVTRKDIEVRSGACRSVVQHLANAMVKAEMLSVDMVRNSDGSGRLALYSAGPRLHEDGLIAIRRPITKESAFERLRPEGIGRAEMLAAMGRSLEDQVAHKMLRDWIAAGELFAYRHFLSKGSFAWRYFRTDADMQSWIAAERARVAEVKAQRAAARKVGTQKIRQARKTAQPKSKPKVKKAEPCNLIAKSMPKTRDIPAKVIPPALLPGEPVVTANTKIDCRKSPAGKYEVTGGLSGLSKLPPGVYLEPESGWASAAKNARYLEAA